MWFSKAPFFRWTIGFIAGIWCYFQLRDFIPFVNPIMFFGSSVALVFLGISNRRLFSISFPVITLVLGFFTAQLHDKEKSKHFFYFKERQEIYSMVKIIHKPVTKNKYTQAEGQIIYVEKNDSLVPTDIYVLLFMKGFKADSLPRYGDVLFIKTHWNTTRKAPKNPYTFDYQKYLRNKNISYTAFIRPNDVQFVAHKPGNWLKKYAFILKDKIAGIIQRFEVSENAKDIVKAMVIGDKSDIDSSTMTSFSASGITHLLAVSGLHVGIIYWVFNWLLSFFKKPFAVRLSKTFLLIFLLWLYAAITGFSASVMRASLMFSIIVIGNLTGEKGHVYNSIALSAFLLLLFNPFLIYNVGFQLSYAAVLGIVSLQPYIAKWFRFKKRIPRYLWELTAVSMAAQLATFPITLLYFHQFPVYFMLANLAAIPLATVFLYLSLAAIALSPFKPIFKYVSWLAGKAGDWLLEISHFVSQLPYSVLKGLYISTVESICIYLIILFISLFFIVKRKIYLYSGLVSVILLLIVQIIDIYQYSIQEKILIYPTQNQLAVDFIHQNKAIFIADTSLFEKVIEYQILPTRNAHHIKQVTALSMNDNFQNAFLKKERNVVQYKNKLLVFHRQVDEESVDISSVNYLVIGKNASLYKIIHQIRPDCIVIFDDSNKKRFINYWKKRLQAKGVENILSAKEKLIEINIHKKSPVLGLSERLFEKI